MVMKLKPTWVTARWFQFFPARPMHEQQVEEEKERRAGHANTTEGWRGRQTKHTKETTKRERTGTLSLVKKTWLIKETFKQNMKTRLWCPWWGVWSDSANTHQELSGLKRSQNTAQSWQKMSSSYYCFYFPVQKQENVSYHSRKEECSGWDFFFFAVKKTKSKVWTYLIYHKYAKKKVVENYQPILSWCPKTSHLWEHHA